MKSKQFNIYLQINKILIVLI